MSDSSGRVARGLVLVPWGVLAKIHEEGHKGYEIYYGLDECGSPSRHVFC